MQYINTSKVTLKVSVKRKLVNVTHLQVVNLDSFDCRSLGRNGAVVVPYTAEIRAKVDKYMAKVKRRAEARSAVADKKKPGKIKTAIKNVVKTVKKKSGKTDAQARVEIKSKLEGLNKANIIELAENVLKINLQQKEIKDNLIKKSLLAAKKIGYLKVLNKIR